MPWPRDQSEDTTQHAADGPADRELLCADGALRWTASHAAPRTQRIQKHEQIQDGDGVQEESRDGGCEQPADRPNRRQLAANGACTQRQRERQCEHDGRVPEREEEADTVRAAPLANQRPCGAIDGGDVIRIESVSEPEDVCEAGKTREKGKAGRAEEKDAAPGKSVEQRNAGCEPEHATHLRGSERPSYIHRACRWHAGATRHTAWRDRS